MRGKRSRTYPPELRKFAITLQFYSSRAYDYVRKIWSNLLPHPSTIRNWYTVVDGRPGFLKESFEAIRQQNAKSPLFLNIVINEMAIRSQIIFENNRFYGCVDLGSGLSFEDDNPPQAKCALMFMAVSLNGNFKIPISYFIIDSLSGSERANLLQKCFELMETTGAKIISITFDGAPCNISMATHLGADFSYGKYFQPYFIHNNEKVTFFGMRATC